MAKSVKIKSCCLLCKNIFFVSAYRKKKGIDKYCQFSCYAQSKIGKQSLSYKKIRKSCFECGTTFFVSPYRKESAKYCSRICTYKNHGDKVSADKCHFWKGGKQRNTSGYILVTNDGKQQYEHRVVVEKYLGRKLRRDEEVHHINEDKKDNRIENLQVLLKKEHISLHAKKRWREEK